MMKFLSDWGFTREGWRSGERGEYLVLLQGVLLIGFVLLPVYRPRAGILTHQCCCLCGGASPLSWE
jgi:hypothetical protein